jgi:hypothetical protein
MASSPRSYFRNYVVIVLIIFAVGILLIRTQRTLADFDSYEGLVDEIKITSYQDTHNKTIPILYLTMKDLKTKFAIRENFGDLNFFTTNLKSGDKVKIYYSHTSEVSTNVIDHYLSQLEKGGIALLDIQESNKENRIVGYILLAVGLIGSVLTTRYYMNNVKGKS